VAMPTTAATTVCSATETDIGAAPAVLLHAYTPPSTATMAPLSLATFAQKATRSSSHFAIRLLLPKHGVRQFFARGVAREAIGRGECQEQSTHIHWRAWGISPVSAHVQ
jgi:hypothetical protein